MDNNFLIQVKKIQKLEITYVLFGQGTRMPFLICDEETFNDQVWVFTTEDKAKKFAEKRKDENQDMLMIMKMEKKQMLGFYSSLYMLGVNEVVFVEEEMTSHIPLDKLIVRPDYSKLPKEKQPLVNPQVQLTGLYFMQELHRKKPNDEKPGLSELEEEMVVNLVRSRFFMAVEVDGDEVKADGSNIKLPCVKNKEGKMFQPIFTDANEFQKFNAKGNFKANMIEFVNIQKVIGQNVEGIVVNPHGMNTVIVKELIPNLIQRYTKG